MTGYRQTSLACPRCRRALEHARSAWGCRACRGVWVEEAVLEEMLRAMDPQRGPRDHHAREVATRLPCPQCSQPLAPVALEDVPVDRCPRGDGVWFDADELELALRNAAPRPPDDRLGPGETAGGILDLLGSLLTAFT